MSQYGVDPWTFLLTMLWCLWFMLPWLLFGLPFGIWVYRDAKKRGMPPTHWFLIALFLNVIGLLLYLFFRIPWVQEHTAYDGV